jgi:Cys-rich four helix bundle protein (predicted Tat secretion target)
MMNRRDLLTNAAAMVAAAAAGRAFATEHEHHDMGTMDMSHHEHGKSTRNAKLIESASDCVLKASICLQHCIVSMGQGERELAECARSSSEVIAMCAALQQLASAESKQLPQLAKVAMETCRTCEDECKKTDKHPECKACGEACAACYKECKALVA